MSNPTSPFTLSDRAVAAVDGSSAPAGSSAGVVMIHDEKVVLRGLPLPTVDNAWNAEAHGVGAALSMAENLGVRQLRLLIDHHAIACIVEGKPVYGNDPDQSRLATQVTAARRRGMEITARVVQGHTESTDLPSRMNELAHILCRVARQEPFGLDLPYGDDWMATLTATEPRLAFPEPWETPRWYTSLSRNEAAHFLGTPPETVDALVRCGHLKVTPKGIPYNSVTEVYAVLQGMRHEAYFGFDGPRGNYEEEVARGWDARLAPRTTSKPEPVLMPDPAALRLTLA